MQKHIKPFFSGKLKYRFHTCRKGYLTDLNYWIKHPFEFSDPILKPEYL